MNEIAQQGQISQESPKQSTLMVGLSIAKLMLKNPGALKKLLIMGRDEERYVRPSREYDLPEYREGMKYCKSNEKYLRPTRYCNPREPLIIAMANELGAYELSDWEFAEAAYWFVKTKLQGEMLPMDGVSATLKRGTGTCYHLTSAYLALCRTAGIKARYRAFKTMMDDVVTDLDVTQIIDLTEAEQEMIPAMFNNVASPMHSEGQVCIDGKWVVADVAMQPELHAHSGVPITQFGEDAIGTVYRLVPGSIRHDESLPRGAGIESRALMWLTPVIWERSNIVLSGTLPLGKKIIEEAGGMEAYDRKARRRREQVPTEQLEEEVARLTKEAGRQQVVEFVERRENK